jgi:hypothetical protein
MCGKETSSSYDDEDDDRELKPAGGPSGRHRQIALRVANSGQCVSRKNGNCEPAGMARSTWIVHFQSKLPVILGRTETPQVELGIHGKERAERAKMS